MQINKTLLEAIALRKCVTVTYNRTTSLLAPHILYTRHDELFIDAVTIERGGQPPREVKLGTFKLTGLNDVVLTDRTFPVYSVFDPTLPKYEGVTLFVVQPD